MSPVVTMLGVLASNREMTVATSVLDNASIRSWPTLAELMSPPANGTTGGRPVLNLTFAVNYAISGLQQFFGRHPHRIDRRTDRERLTEIQQRRDALDIAV